MSQLPETWSTKVITLRSVRGIVMATAVILPRILPGLISLLSISSVVAQEPWDGKPLETSSQEILAAVANLPVPEPDAIEMLFEEILVTYDDKGRRTLRWHQVYRILNDAAIDDFSSVAAAWTPWYQKRPVLRARVINRDGNESILAESEIAELPVQLENNLYTEDRQLQAPLPAVETGSIVEMLTVTEDSSPFFSAGVCESVGMHRLMKTRQLCYRVRAPVALPIQFRQIGDKLKFTETTENGFRNLEWSVTDVPGLEGFESSVPSDIAQGNVVMLTTGKSWADVVATYRDIFEGPLKSQDLKAQADQILKGETNRWKKIQKLLTFVQAQVRYTGLQFGANALTPTAPDEVLRRRYGDCKDQSALLISLLRSVGIEAYPALLRSGVGRDIPNDQPGMGTFNHLIVYIPGSEELWIDPTATNVPAGELPLGDQKRNSLVIMSGETGLRVTPGSLSTANTVRRVREYHIHELLPSTVKETVSYTGASAVQFRDVGQSLGDRELRTALRDRVEADFPGAKIEGLRWSSLRDLSTPPEVSWRCTMSEAVGSVRQIGISVSPTLAMNVLPPELLDWRPWMTAEEIRIVSQSPGTPEAVELEAAKQRPRRNLLATNFPESSEYVFRIHLPLGYKVREFPEPVNIRIGDGSVTSTFVNEADGSVTASFRVDTGSAPLTPEQLREWQQGLTFLTRDEFGIRWELMLLAEHASFSMLDSGELAKGLQIQREELQQHPDSIPTRLRFAETLGNHGFLHAGRELALKTIELAPDEPLVYRSAAYLHQLADFNVDMNAEAHRAIQENCYRKALELNPADREARFGLATCLLVDGAMLVKPNESLEELTELYENIKDLRPQERTIVVQALFFLDRYADILQVVRASEQDEFLRPFRVAARAMLSGAKLDVSELQSLTQDQRYACLLSAYDLVNLTRNNEQKIELLNAALRESDAQRELLEFNRSISQRFLNDSYELEPADTPAGFVQRCLVNAVSNRAVHGEWKDLPGTGDDENPAFIDALRNAFFPRFDRSGNNRIRRPERLQDGLSLLKSSTTGSEEIGFRVKLSLDDLTATFYVVKRDRQYRLIAMNGFPELLAEEALRLVDQNELGAARQLVQWAAEDIPQDSSFFNLMVGAPIHRLWKRSDLRTAAADQTRLAAISMARPEHMGETTTFLREFREQSKSQQQVQIDRVLLSILIETQQYQQALEVVEQLSQSPQGREHLLVTKANLLASLKRFEDARNLLQEQMALHPEDAFLWISFAKTLIQAGEPDKAMRFLREKSPSPKSLFSGSPQARAFALNSIAWTSVAIHQVDDWAIEHAIKAVEERPEDTHALHTLAAAYAERGQHPEAMEAIRKSVARRAGGRLEPADFYIPGRLAEHLEMPEVAATYYKLCVPESGLVNEDQDVTSTYALASKRLRNLRIAQESP